MSQVLYNNKQHDRKRKGICLSLDISIYYTDTEYHRSVG